MVDRPPLVPAYVDLTDFPSMLMECQRLRDSDRITECTPEQNWAAVLLWAASWHQVPASSMPNREDWIAKHAGYQMHGEISPRWELVRPGAMRGYVLCSDDRWYHPVVAEKALEAWRSKLNQRFETEKNRIKVHNSRNPHAKLPSYTFDAWCAAGCPTAKGFLVPVTGTDAACTPVQPPPPAPTRTPVQTPSVTGNQAPREEKVTTTPEPKGSVVGSTPTAAVPPAPTPAPTPPPPPPAPTPAKRRGAAPSTEPAVDEPLTGPEQRSSRPFKRCPRSFVVTEAMVHWANEEYPILDVDELRRETKAFRNHRFKTARVEWAPTWENWIKEAADRKTARVRPGNGGSFQTDRQRRIAQAFPAVAERRGPPPRTIPEGDVSDVNPRRDTPAIGS